MILVVMGPPGAGKGTQAMEIARRRSLAHLSTGDMLRSAVAAGDAVGLRAKPMMAAGELVSDAVMIELVANRINQADCARGFILDGFPRTRVQAQALADLLSVRGRKLDAVIDLKIDDTLLIDRVAGRFTCANDACREGYHDRYKPTAKTGVCDKCGGTSFKRRPDDNAETMRVRLAAYQAETAPLQAFYESGGLLHTVDASGGIDEVATAVDRVVNALISS